MVTETTLQVTGMDCSRCVDRVGTVLARTDGVIRADVDESGVAVVRFDQDRVTGPQLHERIREAGFDVAGSGQEGGPS